MSSPPAKKKTRNSLSLEEKLKALQEVEDSPAESKTNIARRLGLPYSTLTTIIKNENVIRANASKVGPSSERRKRVQEGRFSELEKCLWSWYNQQLAENTPVTGDVLKARALELAKELNVVSDFKASAGWLHRFKKRCGMRTRRNCREANNVDEDTVRHLKDESELRNYNHVALCCSRSDAEVDPTLKFEDSDGSQEYQDDQPSKEYQDDQPSKEYQDDQPSKEYQENQSPREYQDDQPPPREYQDDQLPIPTLTEAIKALEVTQRFVLSNDLSEDNMRVVAAYGRLVYDCGIKCEKEPTCE